MIGMFLLNFVPMSGMFWLDFIPMSGIFFASVDCNFGPRVVGHPPSYPIDRRWGQRKPAMVSGR